MAICKGCKNFMFKETKYGYCEKCMMVLGDKFLAEEEQKRLKVEEEQKRLKAEEEQKRLKVEEEINRLKAEEELKKLKAKEEQNTKRNRQRTIFQQFSPYCDVDCDVFVENDYECKYDDMEFTASIFKEGMFDEAIGDPKYDRKLSLSIKMKCINKKGVLLPVLHLNQRRSIVPIIGTIIRIGEDRYYTDVPKCSSIPLRKDLILDFVDIDLGIGDIKMLQSMVNNQHIVKIRFGDCTGFIPQKVLVDIKDFLSIMDLSGILGQPSLKELPNAFSMFTDFNH